MGVPTVKTLAAIPKTHTAVLQGYVMASGTNDLIKTGFYFGTTSGLGTTYEVDVCSGVYAFKVPNLLPETDYYYNAWSQNSIGIGSGVTSGLTTTSYVREPKGSFMIAWDKELSVLAGSGVSWFRLDQSTLDGPDILASQNWLVDESVTDIIGAWDNFLYSDESPYVMSMEGFSEMRGDLNQAVISEADIVLSNSPDVGDPIDAFNRAFGRYTIRENKNLLKNPSFEFLSIPNWTINSYGDGTYSLGNTVMSGLYSLRLYIPDNSCRVSGAGDANYNGTYIYTGEQNGYPYYTYNSRYLFYAQVPVTFADSWRLDTVLDTSPSVPASDAYYFFSSDISGNYSAGDGTPPAPTVVDNNTNYIIKSDPISVSSGLWYTASIYGLSTEGGIFNMAIVASGLSGIISSGLKVDNTLSSGWTRSEVSYQMPAGVKTAYLNMTTSIHGSNEIFFDCGQFEKGHPATGYDGGFVGDKVLPKRPAKILIDTDDKTNLPVFAGVTETIEPDLVDDTAHIYLHDLGSEFENKQLNSVMYANMKTSDAIELVVKETGLSSGAWIIDEGERMIDFVWFQEGSAWFYLSNIAEAEGGRIFFDNDGIFTFWNHSRTLMSGVSSGTKSFDFSDTDDLSWRVDKDEIKNDIVVKASPRAVQSYQLVYTHGTYEELAPGETKEVWCRITDPDRENEGLPCMAIKKPITGITNDSYYQARPNSDGTGANKDSYVVVTSYEDFAESARVNFKNNDSVTLYITTLKLYGSPAKVSQDIVVEKKDDDSIAIFGIQTLQIENNFINSVEDAETLATNKLIELKDPKTHLHANVIGEPSLKIGEVVSIQDSKDITTASGTIQNLMVKSIKWSLQDEFRQDIEFEKLVY
jgi:hypothetical protein